MHLPNKYNNLKCEKMHIIFNKNSLNFLFRHQMSVAQGIVELVEAVR
jgi:hypothetical protein